MDTFVTEYLVELERKGKSVNTLDAYKRDLRHLTDFLAEEGLDFGDFNEIEVANFIDFLLDLNMSRSTISRHLVSVRNQRRLPSSSFHGMPRWASPNGRASRRSTSFLRPN